MTCIIFITLWQTEAEEKTVTDAARQLVFVPFEVEICMTCFKDGQILFLSIFNSTLANFGIQVVLMTALK